MPKNRLLLFVLPVLLAIALVPTLALGSGAQVTDPQGDGGTLDMADVSVSKTSDGELRHVIKTYAAWQPSSLVSTSSQTPPPALCFLIWTTRKVAEARPDFTLCATATADGRKMRGVLAYVPESGPVRRLGVAQVDRPDVQSVALEISPEQINSPKKYSFTAQTQSPNVVGEPACSVATGCEDFSPARGVAEVFQP